MTICCKSPGRVHTLLQRHLECYAVYVIDIDYSLEEDVEEKENEVSAHGEPSRRIKDSISLQEGMLLSEKPWALTGEIHSYDRPELG